MERIHQCLGSLSYLYLIRCTGTLALVSYTTALDSHTQPSKTCSDKLLLEPYSSTLVPKTCSASLVLFAPPLHPKSVSQCVYIMTPYTERIAYIVVFSHLTVVDASVVWSQKQEVAR